MYISKSVEVNVHERVKFKGKNQQQKDKKQFLKARIKTFGKGVSLKSKMKF